MHQNTVHAEFPQGYLTTLLCDALKAFIFHVMLDMVCIANAFHID